MTTDPTYQDTPEKHATFYASISEIRKQVEFLDRCEAECLLVPEAGTEHAPPTAAPERQDLTLLEAALELTGPGEAAAPLALFGGDLSGPEWEEFVASKAVLQDAIGWLVRRVARGELPAVYEATAEGGGIDPARTTIAAETLGALIGKPAAANRVGLADAKHNEAPAETAPTAEVQVSPEAPVAAPDRGPEPTAAQDAMDPPRSPSGVPDFMGRKKLAEIAKKLALEFIAGTNYGHGATAHIIRRILEDPRFRSPRYPNKTRDQADIRRWIQPEVTAWKNRKSSYYDRVT